MNSAPDVLPTLAPPGAGIPWLERQIIRLMIAWRDASYSPESAASLLRQEQERLTALAERHAAQLTHRVLIPRLRGLEDSSRYWSIAMTLDHLRIVNTGVAGILGELGQGRIPARKVSTADVKPSPDADASVLEPFARSCDAVAAAAAAVKDPRATPRHPHPWFGPFDAARWHGLAGFHMRLHRGQVESIVRGLATGASADS